MTRLRDFPTSIYLDAEALEILGRIQKKTGLTRSGAIRYVIVEYEKKNLNLEERLSKLIAKAEKVNNELTKIVAAGG
jgi:hypothetical protein